MAATPTREKEPGRGAAWRLTRSLLSTRVVEALDRGALLLVAGAGFGKTTALEEGLAARGDAVGWVRCSRAQGDPGRLLEFVVAAVRQGVPGVADVVGDRLAAGAAPIDVELAARMLAEELERLLVDPLTVVFDDAESIADTPAALALVDELLGARSEALRVAVASRRSLALRTAKLRAAGRLTELAAADLAFTPEECAEVVLRRTGRPPEEAEVEALWSATEGWPLAVVLATLAPDRVPTLGAGAGSVFEFLAEEVLDPLPARFSAELVDSSVAPDLDPGLIRALGLADDFADKVRRLGLPLQPLALGDGRWTYHPLVHEFLRGRLRRDRPEERRRELHERCARALEAAGRGPEAVEHWLGAGVPEQAAIAVASHGFGLARTAPGTVSSWLEQLPAQARAAPALRLLEGRLAAGAGRLDEAVGPLRDAVDGFSAEGNEEATWLARVALADTHTILEDFDAAIPLADGYQSAAVPAAPMVATAAAAAQAGATRYREASELFASALEHPCGAPLEPFVRGFHGFWVDLLCGRLDDALAGLREAVRHLEGADPFDRLPYVLGMEAVVRYERGEDAEALAAMQRAQRAAEESLLGGYIGDAGHRFAAGLHARAGRLLEAERELQGATGPGLGWYPGDIDVTRATIAAARGAHAEAIKAAEQAISVGGFEQWRVRWRNTAVLAPVLTAAGRPGRARELVEEALRLRPPLASCVRLLALRAWLRSLEGDSEGALADLALSWEEAGTEAEHLVRRERPRLEPLLWLAVERGTLAPEPVLAALGRAVPSGDALVAFTRHPVPAARREALMAVASTGHPEIPGRLAELEEDADGDVAAAARAWRGRLSREPLPLVFQVLGGFALRRGAYLFGDDDWAGRRPAAQRLVRFLLAHRGTAVSEDALFAAFWPDRDSAAARRSLQVTVSTARSALDPPGAEGSVLVAADRTYRLELSDRDVVDADDFERAASRALDAMPPERAPLEAAAGRWGGEPLPEDRYEDWAVSWRERLIDLERRVLGALADVRSGAGDSAGAVDAARRGVELDPLDEAAQRRLMLAYARDGRRGHALRQYVACRRALIDELGIEPGAETVEVQRRVLAGEPV